MWFDDSFREPDSARRYFFIINYKFEFNAETGNLKGIAIHDGK
jgi:hypothetical protein